MGCFIASDKQKDRHMHKWPVQHAKARFSAMLDACLAEGPQLVTRRSIETAVLVPVDEWHRLKPGAPRSLKQLVLAEEARCSPVLPSGPRPAGERRLLRARPQ
jgi:antitoxin Phd